MKTSFVTKKNRKPKGNQAFSQKKRQPKGKHICSPKKHRKPEGN